MDKSRTFYDTIFYPEFLREAVNEFIALSGIDDLKRLIQHFSIMKNEESWTYDTLEEFLADYKHFIYFDIRIHYKEYELHIWYTRDYNSCLTEVNIKAPTRAEILQLINSFEQTSKFLHVDFKELRAKMNKEGKNDEIATVRPVIFIGHGRDQQWRELKDHLHDKHGYEVLAYESDSRTGQSIKEILEDMLKKASLAILVMTGEDESIDGRLLARQNVIHETGLFQGGLGFNKVFMLLEDGTEKFSNIDGIQYIPFVKGNIAASYGDVIAAIENEFKKSVDTKGKRKAASPD